MSLSKNIKFREIKREIRIVGIDDCPFLAKSTGMVRVIGIVFRGGLWIDGAMQTKVMIDGLDATNKIAEMITSSPHYHQLRIVMLNGVTVAGFNIIDIRELFRLTHLSVLAITREKVKLDDFKNALMHLEKCSERLEIIQNLGNIFKVKIRQSELNLQTFGISREDAEKVVRISCTRGNIPEPLRVAHIIASALTFTDNQ